MIAVMERECAVMNEMTRPSDLALLAAGAASRRAVLGLAHHHHHT
jgi:hypothetical protein